MKTKKKRTIKINARGWIPGKGTTEETTSKVRVETSGLKMEGLTEGGRDSTYIIVQSLSLQAELRGGGVSKLRGEAQVWELHAATEEEHCGGRGGWKGGRRGHQNASNERDLEGERFGERMKLPNMFVLTYQVDAQHNCRSDRNQRKNSQRAPPPGAAGRHLLRHIFGLLGGVSTPRGPQLHLSLPETRTGHKQIGLSLFCCLQFPLTRAISMLLQLKTSHLTTGTHHLNG